MFQAGAAFALELIALGIGFWVLLKTRNDESGNLKGFGSFIAYFIIVSAFLSMLCTGYYTVKYWEDGHFNKPHSGTMMMQGMHRMQGCDSEMMAGKKRMHGGEKCSKMMGNKSGDAKCEKMMKSGMMKGKMGSMMDDESGMQDNEDHEEHHPENDDK